ncbi:hypothetical protein Cgig2_006522 [Carnegiea gigantea]|uniref:Uncharacterized protein n=1 Tax=Carnegiea gigantea TaxID=171969 RepID=A0A9Q1GWP4_9CARY|nr:hypothetical protein Cgig2_006522 [Carnegiea gigantea]
MEGMLGNERTPLHNGQECDYVLYYRRSSSLQILNVVPSFALTSILVKKARVKPGAFCCCGNGVKKCVEVSKDYKNYFSATVLEKVNAEHCGQETYLGKEFYIALYKLLTGRRNWGLIYQFRGVEVIIDIISNHGSPRDFLPSKAHVSQSLSELRSMIDIYKLSTIEIYWLSSKIEETFGVVETIVKIEELVDVDRVKALSSKDLICSLETAHGEGQLNNLSSETSKFKIKEHEILREEERIHKMQEDQTF